MRIEGGARAAGGDGDGGARFGDALARAGAAERGAAADGEARARDPAAAGAPRRRAATADPPPGPGEDPPRPAPPATLAGPAPDVTPDPGLARALRVVPPAAALLGPAGGAPLTLSFGRSLDVDLRATSAGVDVVLRPEPALARAAEADVPRLVAALRVRGLAVARVEVRPRAPSGGRAR